MIRFSHATALVLGLACCLATLIPECLDARAADSARVESAQVESAQVESAQVDARGVRSHVVHSPYQSRSTRIDVILPATLDPRRQYPVVYVLPVEAQGEARFGDAVRELVDLDVRTRRHAIFVVPTFAELPWYADHPRRADAQHEKHLLQVVLPFIEQSYPVKKEAAARLLLGYSKSGWGAWSLLLRHPDVFGRASAWDAPLMMDAPGKYGSGPLFDNLENFKRYQVSTLVKQQSAELRKTSAPPRLILAGYDNFRAEHQQMHGLLESLEAPHVYRDGPRRKHDWHGGWVDESLDLLLDDSPRDDEPRDESPLENSPLVTRIAFGSCAKQDKPQPIWDAIVAEKPQMFVFLGDNIYGDTENMDELRAKYRLLGEQPGYRAIKAICPVHATWDDHDYGVNDGGAEYPRKRESQQAFLDFFDAPADDVRRTREGVYSSHVFGPAGRRIQLILLDARYFRSPLKTGFQPGEPGDGYRGKYVPNDDPTATVLGEAQWMWLEKQLQVPAELRLIGTGVQVVAEEHGSEMWANFPRERARLFATIRKTQAEGVVFLSGDRHLSEIAMLPADDRLGVGYPLVDVTSSSLNAPSGNLTKAGTRFANEINRHRVGLTYFDVNFGMVLVDWEQPDPLVRLQVRDEQGAVVLQQRLKLGQLRRP